MKLSRQLAIYPLMNSLYSSLVLIIDLSKFPYNIREYIFGIIYSWN